MKLKKTASFTAGIIFILSGIFLFLNSPPPEMKDEIFFIEKGETLTSVAKRLKEKNLIRNERFLIYLALFEDKSKVLIGKYKIYKDMSNREIIKRLSRGDVIQRRITIPEGFNIYETAELLEETRITGKKEFLKYSLNREFLDSIGIDSTSIEGFLFPDTYIFAENKDARDVLLIMHKHYKNIIKDIDLSNMKKFNLNIYELINLASLVEKEASIPAERRYISAVFHNRLRKNMTLGCDPTIRYAVKKFKGRITYNDLKFDSPYNTYLHKGLPPTPICSPSKDSILATLNPVETSYLYFVSRNDGSHYFSKTLKEHNRAVDFYQKGINNGFIDNQEL